MPRIQAVGNVSVAIAALLLLPLHYLLSHYARKFLSNDQWVNPTLFTIVPIWLLLLVALLCVTATGGFDWLPLGRRPLYVLTVAATLALAFVSFALIGSYIRPGFTPRFLYYPPLMLVLLGTMLLVLVSVNPQLGSSARLVRLPWTIGAGVSLVGCLGVGGYWLATTGVGSLTNLAVRRFTMPSSQEILAQVAALDPQADFHDLLGWTTRYASDEIREAATARLRSQPDFVERLANELENGHVERAVEFLHSATLSPSEQARLAGPARAAMERWVNRIPAPNYTTKKHLRDLRNWGTEMFRVLPEKFAGSGVDFTPVIADFKER